MQLLKKIILKAICYQAPEMKVNIQSKLNICVCGCGLFVNVDITFIVQQFKTKNSA